MIFLVLKIFVYLLLAAAIGGAAGWLLRNLQAQKTEEDAQRAVHDAKSKVPQLETLLRSRDDQNKKLKLEVTERKGELQSMEQALRTAEQKQREQERELARLRTQGNSGAHKTADISELDFTDEQPSPAVNDERVDQLKAQVISLQDELERRAAQSVDEPLHEVETEALRLQLANVERQLTRAQQDLALEREKVQELERERELQNKSLQVLHQQLEMERSRVQAVNHG
ncbi:MAG: hypothetical protein AAF513_09545 [Pseudomonadota bacterium]